MATGTGEPGDEPARELTPPGPPPAPPPAPGPTSPSLAPGGYPTAPGPAFAGAPPRGDDKALGWTGFWLGVAFCVPVLPLAGVVVSIIALARRRFRPRWVPVVALVAGLAGTGLQIAAFPSFVDGVREGLRESLEDDVEDARRSGERRDVTPLGLRVGDCLDDPQASTDTEEVREVPSVSLVPCEQPHHAEVFHTLPVPGKMYPGQAAIDRRSLDCLEHYTRFVGVRYGASTVDMYTYFPTRSSWQLQDRRIHCVALSPDETVTGSMRDTGRGDVPRPGESIAVDALMPGDCYDTPARKQEADLVMRSCARAHRGEVFAVVRLPAGKYPGDDATSRLTEERCSKRYARFVGIPYDDSRYRYEYWTPTRDTWTWGDRYSICAVHDDPRRLRGSLEGARQ